MKDIKQLAQSARNRMMNRNCVTTSMPAKTSGIKFKVISRSDTNFAERAKEVIDSDSLSPIKELMDMKYYLSLSESGKQKYLLDTIEKFVRYKEKFTQIDQKLVY